MKDLAKFMSCVLCCVLVAITIVMSTIIAIDETKRYICISSFKDYYPVRYNYYLGCQIKPDDKWENVANGAN